MDMKIGVMISFLVMLSFGLIGQNKVESEDLMVKAEDIELILGEWKGQLTYRDYTTNNPFSMPANLSVESAKGNNLTLIYSYPKEPKANGKSKLSISKDGKMIDKKSIVSKSKSGSQIEIITEHIGKDDNKEATIRNIYLIGSNGFIMRKEVRFKDGENWIQRNEYNFKRA